MRNHIKIPVIQESGCAALRNLAMSNHTNRSLIMDEDGAVAIVTAMREHPDEKSVLQNGAGAIANLSSSDEQKMAITSAGAIVVLLAAVQRHPEATRVQAACLCAFANLSVNAAAKALIASSGGTFTILNAMRENLNHEQILSDGCVALLNLMDTSRGKKDAVTARAKSIVEKAVESFPENEKLQFVGTELMRMYNHPTEVSMCAKLLSCGIFDDVAENVCH